jgi:hypothetical protein
VSAEFITNLLTEWAYKLPSNHVHKSNGGKLHLRRKIRCRSNVDFPLLSSRCQARGRLPGANGEIVIRVRSKDLHAISKVIR